MEKLITDKELETLGNCLTEIQGLGKIEAASLLIKAIDNLVGRPMNIGQATIEGLHSYNKKIYKNIVVATTHQDRRKLRNELSNELLTFSNALRLKLVNLEDKVMSGCSDNEFIEVAAALKALCQASTHFYSKMEAGNNDPKVSQ